MQQLQTTEPGLRYGSVVVSDKARAVFGSAYNFNSQDEGDILEDYSSESTRFDESARLVQVSRPENNIDVAATLQRAVSLAEDFKDLGREIEIEAYQNASMIPSTRTLRSNKQSYDHGLHCY